MAGYNPYSSQNRRLNAHVAGVNQSHNPYARPRHSNKHPYGIAATNAPPVLNFQPQHHGMSQQVHPQQHDHGWNSSETAQRDVQETSQAAGQPGGDTNSTNRAQLQQQLDMVETLRRELEAKAEENFDLSASLAAVQVETTHHIEQVEQKSQQEISKLQEALRRAQQEANMARAALKKQQQKQQQELQQKQQQQQAAQEATSPMSKPSDNDITNIVPSGRKSPNGKRTASTAFSAHDTTRNALDVTATSTRKQHVPTLAWHLLQVLAPVLEGTPSMLESDEVDATRKNNRNINSKTCSSIRTLLTRIAASSTAAQQEELEIVWFLVQLYVDCVPVNNSNCRSKSDSSNNNDDGKSDEEAEVVLQALQTVLMYSPYGCRSILQAANMRSSASAMDTTEEDDASCVAGFASPSFPTQVSPKISTIRLGAGPSNSLLQQHLQTGADDLGQPLLISRTDMSTIPRHGNSALSFQSCTPKQIQLARKMIIRLTQCMSCDAPSTATVSVRIVAILLSRTTHNWDASLLEPLLIESISVLAQCRQGLESTRWYPKLEKEKEDDGDHVEQGSKVRGGESKTASVSPAAQGSAQDLAQPQSVRSINNANRVHHHKGYQLLDPVLCELCRQLSAVCHNQSPEALDQELFHSWRKAVVANACDHLEGCVVPSLLGLHGSLTREWVAAIAEWIPLWTTWIDDAQGRQLLRTQFVLDERVAMDHQHAEVTDDIDGASQRRPHSCSAIGVVLQLLYASIVVEKQQQDSGVNTSTATINDKNIERCVDSNMIFLARVLRDQAFWFLHAWLHSPKSRQLDNLSFLQLVSEFKDLYSSVCAWILENSSNTSGNSSDDGDDNQHTRNSSSAMASIDILSLIRSQVEELMYDEEDAWDSLTKKKR